MVYFIDFSGWTKEEVTNWLKENSLPYGVSPGWKQEKFVQNLFDTYSNNPAIEFKEQDCKIYGGYGRLDYYKNKYDALEIKVSKSKVTIQEFYSGKPLKLKNGENLTIQQILLKDNKWWDECHDFIQWIFPTVTQSLHCKDAPILTEEDADFIRDNHGFLFVSALERFIEFVASVNMNKFNHNHLRITRMLESEALILPIDDLMPDTFSLFTTFLPTTVIDVIGGKQRLYNIETFNHWVKALNSKW